MAPRRAWLVGAGPVRGHPTHSAQRLRSSIAAGKWAPWAPQAMRPSPLAPRRWPLHAPSGRPAALLCRVITPRAGGGLCPPSCRFTTAGREAGGREAPVDPQGGAEDAEVPRACVTQRRQLGRPLCWRERGLGRGARARRGGRSPAPGGAPGADMEPRRPPPAASPLRTALLPEDRALPCPVRRRAGGENLLPRRFDSNSYFLTFRCLVFVS